MAIISCPECDKKISSQAATCLGCSYPIASNYVNCPDCGTDGWIDQEDCKQCGFPYSRITSSRQAQAVPIAPPISPVLKDQQYGNVPVEHRSVGVAQAIAATRSYVGVAFLTFFLYMVFYLPGLIMNFVYLNAAKRDQRLSGQSPSGMGCLSILIFFNFYLPILLAVLFIILMLLGVMGSDDLMNVFKPKYQL